MAIPSIAMIPSGYKAEKIYSVLPTNGNADLDFARNSKATRINEQGLIEEMAVNVPILDYSDGTCPSLLLQPQSTNLIQYSEDLSNSIWYKISGGSGSVPVVTSNYGISPSGNSDADRLILNQGTDSGGDDYSIIRNIVSSVDGTSSIWIKSNDSNNYTIQFDNTGGQNSIVVTNSWQRFTYYNESSSRIHLALRNSTENDTADLLVWGAQLEQQSFATSYIKTEGSTQTRLQDTASKSGLENEINSSEGVLYLESELLSNIGLNRDIRIHSNDNQERLVLRFEDSTNESGAKLKIETRNLGNFNSIYTSNNIDFSSFGKIAFKYTNTKASLYINGNEVFNGNSFGTFLNNPLTNIDIDSFKGNIKDLRVYKIALTDAQLTTLTTI